MIEVLEFRVVERGSLKGFAKILRAELEDEH